MVKILGDSKFWTLIRFYIIFPSTKPRVFLKSLKGSPPFTYLWPHAYREQARRVKTPRATVA